MSLTYLRPSRLPILSFLYPRQTPSLLPITTTRNASHASEGRANGAKPGPGKRLGAKKGSTELVVPGNIIFRQRGTHWFPGENCGMGRDHTIFAREKGYVTYYRDPERHPRRKYIGVVFERGMTLPVGRDQPRRRRLGLVGREMSTNAAATAPAATPIEGGPGEVVKEIGEKTFDKEASALRDQPKSQRRKAPQKKQEAQIKLQANYSYREANWEIGRAAEYAGVKVKKYDRNDRFAVWRKRNEKKAEELEKKMLKKARKAKGKNK